ncbi:MAG TPA: winged helix-turn-helix domain-containing protein [Steroidobacteraceae bacterium]|jgi:adenylate cyclase
MDESRGAGGTYEFAGFRLQAAQRRLARAADDQAVELTPKAFDALLYLVRHAGELLDKNTLLRALWPNVVVEENSLNQVISALRRALNDGGGQRLIATVPGRGYQFVVPVAPDTEPSEAPVAAVAQRQAAATPASPASIAVLPFASLSSDPEKDFFGEGIAEELIHLLARVPGLKVPARTSSFAYKGRKVDARDIARDLGVGMLLEGSVRSAGDRIRVTAQLIEAESGFHVWSQTYDRQFADVFELQDELAASIVQALRLNLGDGVAATIQAAPPTRDVDAYRMYLQARSLWIGLGFVEHGATAIELLQRCLSLDPNFARAHAQIATIYMFQFNLGMRGPEVLREAQREVDQALELDPELADAHALLGALRGTRCEWAAADASFRRALALDPAEPLTRNQYALWVLGPTGKMQRAVRESEHCYRLAPAVASSSINLGGYLSMVGQQQQALKHTRIAIDLGYGEQQPPIPLFLAQIARAQGRHAEGAEAMLPIIPASLRSQGADDVVRQVFAACAEPSRAESALTALRALCQKADAKLLDTWPMTVLTLNWFVLLGAIDDAYRIADRLVDRFRSTRVSNSINLPPIWLAEMREFRRDPRFEKFATELGLLDFWSACGPPDGYELRDGRLSELT